MKPLKDIDLQIDRCSKCGTCRAHCPLFKITRHEPMVARGKVQLARRYLAGEIPYSKRLEEIFSQCLLCKTCFDACPNEVETDAVVCEARIKLTGEKGLSLLKKIGLKHVLPYNKRLELLARVIRAGKISGMTKLMHVLHLWELFPNRAGDLEKLFPVPARTPLRKQYPSLIEPGVKAKGRVAYFTGCMTNLVYPGVGHAVIRILKTLGLEIHLPEQVCCGIPALAHGDLDTFKKLAEKNIRNFGTKEYDAIIVDCASCGSTWRAYPRWTGFEQAEKLAGLVIDISQFVVMNKGLQRLDLNNTGKKDNRAVVTYHDPCHLKKGMKVDKAPREILNSLPGYTFKEMENPYYCCGAAGSYCFTYYDVSREIVKQKIKSIIDTGASVVATACPSCAMQLTHGLREAGYTLPVKHIAELLADSLVNHK